MNYDTNDYIYNLLNSLQKNNISTSTRPKNKSFLKSKYVVSDDEINNILFSLKSKQNNPYELPNKKEDNESSSDSDNESESSSDSDSESSSESDNESSSESDNESSSDSDSDSEEENKKEEYLDKIEINEEEYIYKDTIITSNELEELDKIVYNEYNNFYDTYIKYDDDDIQNKIDIRYIIFYNYIIKKLAIQLKDENDLQNKSFLIKELNNVLKNNNDIIHLFNKIVNRLIDKNYLKKNIDIQFKNGQLMSHQGENITTLIAYINNIIIEMNEYEDINIDTLYKLTNEYKLTNKITDETKLQINNLIKYYKENPILTILNKEYYINSCINNYELSSSPFLVSSSRIIIDQKYKDLLIQHLDFFNKIRKLYNNCYILNLYDNYLKVNKETDTIDKNIYKELSLYKMEQIIKNLYKPLDDINESFNDSEKKFLYIIKFNINESLKKNPDKTEIEIINYYIDSLYSLLEEDYDKIDKLYKLDKINKDYYKIIKSIDIQEQYLLIDKIYKYLRNRYNDRIQIHRNIKQIIKDIKMKGTNTLDIDKLNKYMMAIIYVITNNKNTINLLNKLKHNSNQKELSFINKLQNIYLIKDKNVNNKSTDKINQYNIDELYREIVFILKDNNNTLKDPLKSNLNRRKLRNLMSYVIEDSVYDEKINGTVSSSINNCIKLHKSKKWLNIPEGYQYFIAHPKYYNKEKMYKNKDKSIIYYGNLISNIELEDSIFTTRELEIYEPTDDYWKLYCNLNYLPTDEYKCNYVGMIYTFTDKNKNVRKFINGLYNKNTGDYKILTEKDYQKECNWFQKYNNSIIGKINNLLKMKISDIPLEYKQTIKDVIIDKLKKIYMPYINNQSNLNQEIYRINMEYNLNMKIEDIMNKIKELDEIIENSSNNSLYNYLLIVNFIISLFSRVSPLFDMSAYGRYIIYYYPDLSIIFKITDEERVLDNHENIDLLNKLLIRFYPYFNHIKKDKFDVISNYINKYININIDLDIINIYKKYMLLDNISSNNEINMKSKLNNLEDIKMKEQQNIIELLDIKDNINRFTYENDINEYYKKIENYCSSKNTLFKIYINDKNNHIQCVTKNNYKDIIKTNLISDNDKKYIENYFTTKMNNIVDLLINIYKNNINLKLKGHFKDKNNMKESIIKDISYEDIDEIFIKVERILNKRISKEERIKLMNKLDIYYNYVDDIDVFTKDINILMNKSLEYYIDEYIKDIENRLDKYSNLENTTNEELKNLIENDYENRFIIFKNILDALHYKYNTTIYNIKDNLLDSSEHASIDYYVIEYISQKLEEVIKYRVDGYDFDLITNDIRGQDLFKDSSLNKKKYDKIRGLPGTTLQESSKNSDVNFSIDKQGNNRCHICDRIMKDEDELNINVEYKDINENIKISFCSVECSNKYKYKTEGYKPYHNKNRGVKSMTEFIMNKCINKMIEPPSKDIIIDELIKNGLEKFNRLDLSKKQLYDLIISLKTWEPDFKNKNIQLCIENISILFEKDISEYKSNGKYNYKEIWNILVNDPIIQIKERINNKLTYKYEMGIAEYLKRREEKESDK